MNPEGGFCGMPTQFLGTIRVGGKHRIPRWVKITENSAKKRLAYTQYQQGLKCTKGVTMYLPLELLTLDKIALPTSPALSRFEVSSLSICKQAKNDHTQQKHTAR